MAPQNPLLPLFERQRVIIIDGALATLLETRGCDLNHSLWSAKILMSNPELIQQVHYDYYSAGADIAITSSYQATPLGLSEAYGFSGEESSDLIAKSAELAFRARSQVLQSEPGRLMLVAGSIGPYGAYLADGSEYRGDYALEDSIMRAFHRPRIATLVAAGVDLLACETIPSLLEAMALLHLIEEEFPDTSAWFSFTLKDAEHLSDGTPLADLLPLLESDSVVAVGVNCVSRSIVGPVLKLMSGLTRKPLLVYPNSGELYDAQRKIWYSGDEGVQNLAGLVRSWIEHGAVLVGGCCRTDPGDIQTISSIAHGR